MDAPVHVAGCSAPEFTNPYRGTYVKAVDAYELVNALKAVEWVGRNGGDECSGCGFELDPHKGPRHAPDCIVDKALKRWRPR
jgi:hypothetical protein